METQKGPYNDYSPSKRGAIWVSMLVWGSVVLRDYEGPSKCTQNLPKLTWTSMVLPSFGFRYLQAYKP